MNVSICPRKASTRSDISISPISDDTDTISFDEFVSFQNLMGTSSFEILGLAHVLDKDENDRISVEEWKAALQDLVPPKELFERTWIRKSPLVSSRIGCENGGTSCGA